MTDKVKKIREELARLKEETSIGLSEYENGVEQGRMEIINALSLLLDSMQEEPKTDWLQELQEILDSLSKEDFKKVFDKYAVDFNEEPVSEDLDIAIGEYCSNPDNFITYIDVAFAYRSEQKDDIPLIVKAIKFGAKWQKEQMLKQSVKGKVIARFPLASDPFYDDVEIYLNFTKGLSEGDKVKVIVIKED